MNKDQSAKHKIINASKELFVAKGFTATTTREIADKSGVNSALIQYHFKGKQGLLLAIVAELAEDELEIFTMALDGEIESIEEVRIKLMFFSDMIILRGLKKWQAIKIVVNESYELSQIDNSGFNMLSTISLKNLEGFFQKAKKKSFITKDINISVLSDNLMSLVIEQILNWQVNKITKKHDIADKNTRRAWLNHTLDIFLNGVLNKNKLI